MNYPGPGLYRDGDHLYLVVKVMYRRKQWRAWFCDHSISGSFGFFHHTQSHLLSWMNLSCKLDLSPHVKWPKERMYCTRRDYARRYYIDRGWNRNLSCRFRYPGDLDDIRATPAAEEYLIRARDYLLALEKVAEL